MSRDSGVKVTIRDIQPSDFSAVADFSAAALNDDYFEFVCPYRHQFPLTFRDLCLRLTKGRSFARGSRVFVAEVEEHGIKKVVGWAAWRAHKIENPDVLHDETWKAPTWLQEKSRSIESKLLSFEDKYISVCNLDRSVSPSAQKAVQESKRQDPFAAFGPAIYLSFLTVDQNYARRGIGAKLVKWGIGIAEREGLPICLKASDAGRGLYSKLGFKVIATVQIVGGPSLPCMVWQSGRTEDHNISADHDDKTSETVPEKGEDLLGKRRANEP